MTLAVALTFLRGHHRAVLATRRRDGGPQLSPVLAAVDDDESVLISTRETAVKTGNVLRRPTACLLVLSDAFFGPWWTLEGSVTVEHLPAALPTLEHYYRLVGGEHPDWDDYRRAMERERRVILRLRAAAAGPKAQG
ncbi:MAG TPA: PPOX class F420-dependent oxidoreductase [Candidatus Micrarchaeia archaeon]|nr:PPOX class F420-dependent oxidoreductase [Candidatus Micrarchaeia archaeon]